VKNAIAVLLLFVAYWAGVSSLVIAVLDLAGWRYPLAAAILCVAVSLALIDRGGKPPGS